MIYLLRQQWFSITLRFPKGNSWELHDIAMMNDHFHSFSKILPWLILNFLGTAVRLKSWSNPCRRGPPAGCLREALHAAFSPWESIGWKHGVHWNLTVVESWYLYFACCTWFLGVFFPLCSAYPCLSSPRTHAIPFVFFWCYWKRPELLRNAEAVPRHSLWCLCSLFYRISIVIISYCDILHYSDGQILRTSFGKKIWKPSQRGCSKY